MKKHIRLLSIVFVLIMLVGCNVQKENDDASANSPDPSKNVITNEGERPTLCIEEYNEYLKLVESQVLPDAFVKYEAISGFGDFSSLVILSDFRNDEYSTYMYSLIDQTDTMLNIYIEHEKEKATSSKIISETVVNKKDLRVISSNDTGKFETEGITYTYVSGELLTVSWKDGNITYTISYDTKNDDITQKPINDTTMFGKLLNIETATAVISKIGVTDAK